MPMVINNILLYQAVGKRDLRTTRLTHAQQTQNICITFRHLYNVGPASKTDVEDIGPTLYKCYTPVLCLLGAPSSLTQLFGAVGALKKVFRIFFRKPPNLVPWSATWLSIFLWTTRLIWRRVIVEIKFKIAATI